MKKSYTIHTVSIYDSIVIFGHRFNGLAEIRKAVELFMHDNREPYQASMERHQPVEGVHVLCNYEPYPTFDIYDAMCEDRDYENYYFLDRPFTKEETDAIAAWETTKNRDKDESQLIPVITLNQSQLLLGKDSI